jgi:excisionase family DNA binding protein
MSDLKELPAATYSRREAAAFFGISVRTFDRIQQSNAIPYVRIGKRCRYLLSDLQNYLNSNRSI